MHSTAAHPTAEGGTRFLLLPRRKEASFPFSLRAAFAHFTVECSPRMMLLEFFRSLANN